MAVLQFKNMTTMERQNYIPYSAEPIWDTNEEKLYVGNGIDTGGSVQGSVIDISSFPKMDFWTPSTIINSGGGTVTNPIGHYLKVGNIVNFRISLRWDDIATVLSNITISLPQIGMPNDIHTFIDNLLEDDTTMMTTPASITTMTVNSVMYPAIDITIDNSFAEMDRDITIVGMCEVA